MKEDILETTAAIASGEIKTHGQRFDRYQDYSIGTNKIDHFESDSDMLQYPVLALNLVKSSANQAISYVKSHRTQAITAAGILGLAGIGYLLLNKKKPSLTIAKSKAKKPTQKYKKK